MTQDKSELETLFSNITDIYEITVTLLGSLEDIMEIAEEKQTPTVGSCFEELAEAAEFDVYIKYVSCFMHTYAYKFLLITLYLIRYARDINSPASREVLTNLLSRPEANTALRAAGHGFREAVKYYLPKLLLQPIWHCFLYFNYIKVLWFYLYTYTGFFAHIFETIFQYFSFFSINHRFYTNAHLAWRMATLWNKYKVY